MCSTGIEQEPTFSRNSSFCNIGKRASLVQRNCERDKRVSLYSAQRETKSVNNRVFHSKNSKKKLPLVGLDLIITGLGVQCLTRSAKQAFAYKFKTFRSLYSHALLIIANPLSFSKSKLQVVHEQKFKDPLNSTCLLSSYG